MSYSVHDFKQFYARRAGRLVRRLISARIDEFWPDTRNRRIAGYGYAVPYLRSLLAGSGNVCAIMPAQHGVHHWPEEGPGLVCLGKETEWPLESESVDLLLLVHGFEFSEAPDLLLQECWRVLKSGGRMLVVVPNRLGFWARSERNPFGHGTPYTVAQIGAHLQKNMFMIEAKKRALYMPPFRSFLVLRTAYVMESLGKYLFPGLAGIHMIEASKQIYGVMPKGRQAMAAARRGLVRAPVPT